MTSYYYELQEIVVMTSDEYRVKSSKRTEMT